MNPLQPVAATDLAPLSRRLGLLQVLRLGLAFFVTAAAVLAPRVLGDHPAVPLAALSTAYALASGLLEVLRRRLFVPSVALVGGLVLFDGLYLATVLSLTGGTQSVLSFLVLVHVIAVTLLLSFRSGLKTALWHTLLLFGIAWLQRAGVVSDAPAASVQEAPTFRALALLMVAATAAWFSSLNEEELRRGKNQLRTLAAMAARMAATHGPAPLVHALLDGVAEAFRFPRTAVLVHDEGTFRAFVLGPEGGLREAATASACDSVVGTGSARDPASPVLVRRLDPDRDPLLSRALPDAVNVVVVPLVTEGQLEGALAVERGGGRQARVGTRTLDLLVQFAAHAALALRAAALQATVKRLADTDVLTGLANRRVFQATLTRELALARRRSEPCALILFDIDHFKSVNDTFGHQIGDEVLRAVGRAVIGTARESDVAARYGGEEFAVILPGCATSEALVVADRLREAVANVDSPVAVTVSAGVASFPLDGSDDASLVAAADQALYRAKAAGRNCSMAPRRRRRVVA